MDMSAAYQSSRLDELLQRLFDEQLSPEETAELNALLRGSPAARDHYRRSLRLHAALIRHRQARKVIPIAAVAPSRSPWPRRVLWAAAACVVLGITGSLVFRAPAARLTGTTGAVWAASPTAENGRLPAQPLDLVSGFAEIGFRNGVRVIVEGPCHFEVTSANSMLVSHGRATVKVPHHLDGFHLDTPAGRITDLGTEFGVAVGSGVEGPVILAEVFDGEIEIPAETTPRKRLQRGDSLAIVRETAGTRLVSTLGDYRIDLADSARTLPASSASLPSAGNLALGKPVTSPAWYEKTHGNVFPPSALTDGRLNDSGSPGDWSFWLAPNGAAGEFTVDLLENRNIGRVELQNTRNRTYGDRGLRGFKLLVSADGSEFKEVLAGELPRVTDLPAAGMEFPFESFTLPPVNARYVKVVGLSHYHRTDRPPEDLNQGGGLNEIRIFAP